MTVSGSTFYSCAAAVRAGRHHSKLQAGEQGGKLSQAQQ
jgi:hypothetical protein